MPVARARRRRRAAQERVADADLRRRPARPLHMIGSEQGPALGVGDPRRGGRRAATPTSTPRRRRWGRCSATSTCRRRTGRDAYDALYAEYVALHDYFGRGGNDDALRSPAPASRRACRCERQRSPTGPPRRSARCTRSSPRYGLVAWTSGNLSAPRPGRGPDGDQAERRPVRRPDARRRWSCATSTATSSKATRPLQRHRDARLHLPRDARGGRRGPHPQPVRDGVGGARRADPVRADRDGGRVRRRDPGRAVRADRRRGDRAGRSSRRCRTTARPPC